MNRVFKKILSIVIVLIMIVGIIPISAMANGNTELPNIDDVEKLFVYNPDYRCTLSACLMMFRRGAIINRDLRWSNLTLDSYTNSWWWSYDGLSYSPSGFGMNGKAVGIKSIHNLEPGDYKLKKSLFQDLLADHPEGVVLYIYINSSHCHAVLLTKYDDSTDNFYCWDPGSRTATVSKLGDSGLLKATITDYCNRTPEMSDQDYILAYATQYWYVESGIVRHDHKDYMNFHGDCTYSGCDYHQHVYGDDGYCVKDTCKADYMQDGWSEELITGKKGVANLSGKTTIKVKSRPYAAASNVDTISSVKTEFLVLGKGRNSIGINKGGAGNLWYHVKIKKGTQFVEGYINENDVLLRDTENQIAFHIYDHSNLPNSFVVGTKVVYAGYVASQANITSISASLYNKDGTALINEVSKSFYGGNLVAFTEYVEGLGLSKLEPGDYSLKISATDNRLDTEHNTSEIWKSFSVKNKALKKYTVSFDATGGTPSIQTVNVVAGNSINLNTISKPQKNGYYFLGWSPLYNSSIATYSAEGSFLPGNNVTLYGVWEMITPPSATYITTGTKDVGIGAATAINWVSSDKADDYVVTYYKADGTVLMETETAATSDYPIFDEAGTYTAKVKCRNCAGTSDYSYPVTINVHGPSTVTFLNYDGTVWATQSVAYGESATIPAEPQREGYTFSNWDGSLYGIKEDTTLTAAYTPIVYTVTFYDFEGNVAGNPQQVTYSGDTPGSATPPDESVLNAPEGYMLAGWDTDEYLSVKRNLDVHPGFIWENADVPLTTDIGNITKAGEGYWINYSITNHVEEAQQGRLVVVLKSGSGKFLTRTESGAFYLDAASGIQTESYSGCIYVPLDKSVIEENDEGIAEIYVLKSYDSLAPISNMQWDNLTEDGTVWSEWMTDEEYAAFSGDKSNSQEKTEYRTKSRTYSDWMTNTSYLDWDRVDTKMVKGDWGDWSSWSRDVVSSDEYTDVQTTSIQDSQPYNLYRYGRYQQYDGGLYFHFHQDAFTNTYSCPVSLHYSEWSTTRYSPVRQLGHWYWSYNNSVGTGYYNGSVYQWAQYTIPGQYDYYWEEVQTVQGNSHTEYRYRTRTDVELYKYAKWNDWSDWQSETAEPTQELQVESRTLHRVKIVPEATEDGITITGQVTGLENAANRLAILNIYKVDEASDYSNEYMAQTTLAEDGSYSFRGIHTYETPSSRTGDFTATLTIEGSTGPIFINTGDTFKAPKANYSVTFIDSVTNEQIGTTQTVEEGGSAEAPTVPLHDGYVFIGWEYGLNNIRENMEIRARYIPRNYTVVFADYMNGAITLETDVEYGTAVSSPTCESVEGYNFIGWEVEEGLSLDCVTRTMVARAHFEPIICTVNFLDGNGEIFNTQSVKYGESAAEPDFSTMQIPEGMYFAGWSSAEYKSVTQPLNILPNLYFNETSVAAVPSIESGVYEGDVSISYTTADANAKVKYTIISEGDNTSANYLEPISLSTSATVEVTTTSDNKNPITETFEYVIVPEGTTPNAPENVSAAVNEENVRLTWDETTGADGYVVYKTDDYGAEETYFTDSNSFTDTNLHELSNYCYEVSSFANYGSEFAQAFLESEDRSQSCEVSYYGSKKAVTGISIESDDTALLGNPVQLTAEVSPSAAYNKELVWTVENGTGNATITESGILVGTKAGSVTVTATALDGSGVSSSVVILVQDATDGSVVIEIPSVNTSRGRRISVPVIISENSDVTALQFSLLYDETKLTLDSAEEGTVMAELQPQINAESGIIHFLWDGLTGLTEGGSLLNLSFTVKQDVNDDDIILMIPTDNSDIDFICLDSSFVEADCTVKNGLVSVRRVTFGDINNDGKVNVVDVSLARRYCAKLISLSDTELIAADVSGDGIINVLDVNLMRRYAVKLINVFPVEEGE